MTKRSSMEICRNMERPARGRVRRTRDSGLTEERGYVRGIKGRTDEVAQAPADADVRGKARLGQAARGLGALYLVEKDRES